MAIIELLLKPLVSIKSHLTALCMLNPVKDYIVLESLLMDFIVPVSHFIWGTGDFGVNTVVG